MKRWGQDDKEVTLAKLVPLDWWIIVFPDHHENRTFINQARLQTFILIALSLFISLLIGFSYVYSVVRNFRQLIKGINGDHREPGRQIRF